MRHAILIGLGACLLGSSAWADAGGQGGANIAAFPAGFFSEARPNTAMDMINRLPGFVFDSGAQVRGFGAAAGNVLIDGQRPTSKQDDLESILRRIPAAQVARIELIHGAVPGIDMQGKTLIANVVRKSEASHQTTLAGAYDYTPTSGRNMPSLRVETSQRDGATSFEGSVLIAQFQDDGAGAGRETYWSNPALNPGAACRPSCVEHLAARAGGWQDTLSGAYATPVLGGKLRLNATLTGTVYGDREGDSGPVVAENSTLNATNRDAALEMGVNYQHRLPGRAELELIALQQFHQFKDDDYYNANGLVQEYKDYNRLSESILRAIIRHPVNDTLRLTVDGEGAYNFQRTGANFMVGGVATPVVAGDIRVDETRLEGGATLAWTLSSSLNLEGAVRYESSIIASSGDVTAQKSLGYLKPRLVVSWTPLKTDQIRLRLERLVGQLDFSAFVASGQLNTGLHAGNPSLLPQTETLAEITYQHSFWSSGAISITYGHSELNQTVDRIRGFNPADPTNPAGFYDTPGNIGAAHKDELTTDLSLPLGRLGDRGGLFKATLGWRWIPVTDPVTGASRPQSQVHPFHGEAHLIQDLSALKSSVGIDARFARTETYYRFGEIDHFRFGTYLGLFAEYKPPGGVSYRLEADNLTNRATVRDYVYYQSSRPSAVQSSDLRQQFTGPLFHFRVRKTY